MVPSGKSDLSKSHYQHKNSVPAILWHRWYLQTLSDHESILELAMLTELFSEEASDLSACSRIMWN